MEMLIARRLIEQIIAHALSDPEHEVCGLLFGDDNWITAAEPTANVHPDPSAHFEVDPSALIAAHRAEREGGRRLIGHYHSHPSGRAFPSARDAAFAEPDRLWLIAAGQETALFRAMPDGEIAGAFCSVAMRIDPS